MNLKLNTVDKLKYSIGTIIDKILYKQSTYNNIKNKQNFLKNGYAVSEDKWTYNLEFNGKTIKLRKNSSDLLVFDQVFLKEEYKAIISIFQNNNLLPKVIVDAGSNIGLAALQFQKAFPQSKIYAIEPDPANYEALTANIGYSANCTLFNKAIWNKRDTLFLSNSFGDGDAWAKSVSKEGSTSFKVEAISINDLMELEKIEYIDILKIDVEGSEATIFQSDNDLSFLDKTSVISVEIHDVMNCRSRIYEILTGKDFFLFDSNEMTIGVKKSFISKLKYEHSYKS